MGSRWPTTSKWWSRSFTRRSLSCWRWQVEGPEKRVLFEPVRGVWCTVYSLTSRSMDLAASSWHQSEQPQHPVADQKLRAKWQAAEPPMFLCVQGFTIAVPTTVFVESCCMSMRLANQPSVGTAASMMTTNSIVSHIYILYACR